MKELNTREISGRKKLNISKKTLFDPDSPGQWVGKREFIKLRGTRRKSSLVLNLSGQTEVLNKVWRRWPLTMWWSGEIKGASE